MEGRSFGLWTIVLPWALGRWRVAGIRDKIASWTHEGLPFELIEQRISRLPASDEDKSALWVWAWTYRSTGRQLRGARRVLAD
jgi:hypothetical protein